MKRMDFDGNVFLQTKSRPEPGAAGPTPRPDPDLSAEISLAVEREKGEQVRCRRVFGDNYRCNWLAPDVRPGNRGGSLALETYRVRNSRLLRVRKTEQGLVIEDVTAQAKAAGNN